MPTDLKEMDRRIKQQQEEAAMVLEQTAKLVQQAADQIRAMTRESTT